MKEKNSLEIAKKQKISFLLLCAGGFCYGAFFILALVIEIPKRMELPPVWLQSLAHYCGYIMLFLWIIGSITLFTYIILVQRGVLISPFYKMDK